MAGAMRKAMVYLGLVEDDDRYHRYDHDGYDADGYEGPDGHDAGGYGSAPEGRHHAPSGRGMTSLGSAREERGGHGGSGDSGGSVATMQQSRTGLGHGSRAIDRITTIHPRTYNEAKQIGESFREGTPVIMNLSDMDDSDAKRLVDFAAGLVFGRRGTIERVTSKVFLLSPADVTVTAEDKARMAESGFFNQS